MTSEISSIITGQDSFRTSTSNQRAFNKGTELTNQSIFQKLSFEFAKTIYIFVLIKIAGSIRIIIEPQVFVKGLNIVIQIVNETPVQISQSTI